MKRPRLKGKDWAWGDFNPKTEMKMGKLRQDFGAETVWKNRSHTRSGLVSFSKPFLPGRLMQIAYFHFGFRV